MRRLVKLVVLNHRVVARGRLVGRLQIETGLVRAGACWF